MRKFVPQPGPVRPAEMALRVVLVVMLSVAGLAACGNNATSSAPTTSDGPAIDGSPMPSTSPSAPVASPAAGTSPSPVPSDAGSDFDACSLIDPAELSKVLGEGVQAKPMPGSGWVAGQCAWNGTSSGFFLAIGTTASIAASGDGATPDAASKLAQFKQQASGTGKPTDVPGIGDGAVLGSTGMAAYQGDTYLQITNLGLTSDQLIEVAKLAVDRL